MSQTSTEHYFPAIDRQQLLVQLLRILPLDSILHHQEDLKPYECDGLSVYQKLPLMVVLPDSVEQIQSILLLCNELNLPVVTRGAGTGLSGGALPYEQGLLLSLAKLNSIIEINSELHIARVQPGVPNLAISQAVNHLGLYYAPDPSSQIACTIGGNVAENSGGVHSLKYGLTLHNIQQIKILNISQHSGIINYDPTELVITARAGTSLKTIKQVLAENRQMLAFEPPDFAGSATLGGTIACNFSGPRRAYSGAVRDYVLGTRVINGKAEILSFGGEVMKNVAGYDVSRLMVGAMGTLGVILEASIKVVPMPENEITLVQDIDIVTALSKLHDWSALPLPISASCFYQHKLYIRFSGTEKSLLTAEQKIGGEICNDARAFWSSIKEQTHDFFNNELSLWRISLASNTVPLTLEADILYEWGGALRWLKSDQSQVVVRESCEKLNGHTTLFRSLEVRDEVFQKLPQPLLKLHQNLKYAFDPHGIFNIGRLYGEF